MTISVIPAFSRLRKEDNKFKASLGYIVRACLLKKRLTSPWWLGRLR
jgi:hypothetical protein